MLIYAEGAKSGGFSLSEISSLSVMKAPGWVSSQLLAVPGQPTYGVFSSPDGSAALWQTANEEANELPAGPAPPFMLWNVIDLQTGLLVESDSTQQQILDWK
jgi:hypothetical protein